MEAENNVLNLESSNLFTVGDGDLRFCLSENVSSVQRDRYLVPRTWLTVQGKVGYVLEGWKVGSQSIH